MIFPREILRDIPKQNTRRNICRRKINSVEVHIKNDKGNKSITIIGVFVIAQTSTGASRNKIKRYLLTPVVKLREKDKQILILSPKRQENTNLIESRKLVSMLSEEHELLMLSVS